MPILDTTLYLLFVLTYFVPIYMLHFNTFSTKIWTTMKDEPKGIVKYKTLYCCCSSSVRGDYRRRTWKSAIDPEFERNIFDKVGIVHNPSAFFGKFGGTQQWPQRPASGWWRTTNDTYGHLFWEQTRNHLRHLIYTHSIAVVFETEFVSNGLILVKKIMPILNMYF